MTRTDKILIFGTLTAALMMLLVFYGWQHYVKKENVAVIRAEGKIIKEIKLGSTAGRQELDVSGRLGVSRLEINNHQITFIESPCPDKICIHRGWLNKPGDVAVCLPNQVSVEIKGDKPKLNDITR